MKEAIREDWLVARMLAISLSCVCEISLVLADLCFWLSLPWINWRFYVLSLKGGKPASRLAMAVRFTECFFGITGNIVGHLHQGQRKNSVE